MSGVPRRLHRRRAALALALLGPLAAAAAEKGGALLPGSTGREPISVDAGRLDYFDKEQKLVYSGDVVARQGASTLKGSVLTLFLARGAAKDAAKGEASPGGPGLAGSGGAASIDRMEVQGPVTVLSQDEIGTGDSGSYSKATNRITLTGHVTLTQATNVIKGDRLVYDMTSGQAQVSGGETEGRVRSVFTPGSGTPGPAKRPKAATP